MKVLIVDDDTFKIKEIIRSLNKLGIDNIKSVSSLREMYSSLKEDTFDLIILDNNFPEFIDSLPKRNLGLETLYMISQRKLLLNLLGKAKVIICSSDDIDEDISYDFYLGNIIYDSSIDILGDLKSFLGGIL